MSFYDYLFTLTKLIGCSGFFSVSPISGTYWHWLSCHGLSGHCHHPRGAQCFQHPTPDKAEAVQQPGCSPDQGPWLAHAGPQAETGQVSRAAHTWQGREAPREGGMCKNILVKVPLEAHVQTGQADCTGDKHLDSTNNRNGLKSYEFRQFQCSSKKYKFPFGSLQVFKLFCHEVKSHRGDPGSLGSPEFPWWQSEHAGSSSWRNGKTRNSCFFGSRRKLLMQPWHDQEGQTQGVVMPCYCKQELKWKPRPMSYTRDVSEKKANKQKKPALTFTRALLVHCHRIRKRSCKVVPWKYKST